MHVSVSGPVGGRSKLNVCSCRCVCLCANAAAECHPIPVVAETLLKERGHCGVTGLTAALHCRPKNIPCQRSREKPSAIQASQ